MFNLSSCCWQFGFQSRPDQLPPVSFSSAVAPVRRSTLWILGLSRIPFLQILKFNSLSTAFRSLNSHCLGHSSKFVYSVFDLIFFTVFFSYPAPVRRKHALNFGIFSYISGFWLKILFVVDIILGRLSFSFTATGYLFWALCLFCYLSDLI